MPDAADNRMEELTNTIAYRLHTHPHIDDNHNTLISVDREAAGAVLSRLGARLKPGVNGRSAFEIPPIIIDLFTADLKMIVKALGGIEPTIAVAQQAYKQYVEPIDLPNVPNFIEPTVDHAMYFALGAVLREAWNKLQTMPEPTPTPVPAGDVGSSSPIGDDH